jgi:DsbC/DsbD-like thiol-disulfide interchange protein
MCKPALLALLLLTLPATAAETAWQEVAPDVRLRLIASESLDAAGRTLVGLEVDMPADHKTYWAVPGETGIPTTLDLSGSVGVDGFEMLWPFPVTELVGGYLDRVYHGPTVLPFRLLATDDKALVEVAAVMGICSDICVPAMANFTLQLDFRQPDTGQGLRLAQAAALVPIPWDGAEPALGAPQFDAATEELLVPVLSADVDPASIIADAGLRGPLFGAPQKSPETSLVRIPLLGGAEDGVAAGALVTLTFDTPRGPFNMVHEVLAAGSTPANP